MNITEIQAAYRDYVARLAAFREKVKEDRKWFEQSQTELQGNVKEKGNVPNSHSGHIFNAVQYKHADMMDNFPCANILPREESDEEGAKLLTEIVPFVLDSCDFKKTYSLNLYDKLISGTAVYGVFYDTSKREIVVKGLDILNFAWQPDTLTLQDSRYVFYDTFMSVDDFKTVYGEDISGCAMQSSYHEQKENAGTEVADTVVITDGYYKKQTSEGKSILHFVKFSGNKLLFSSEDGDGFLDGFYRHGRYPFVFDVINPVPGKLVGMGIVDISKNLQANIDRLDFAITKNALVCSSNRHFISKNSGINKDSFLDCANELIEVQGDIDGKVKRVDFDALPSFVVNHRNDKIEELKEICGNRDFAQGGTTAGVTSGNAITALQTASDKLVRDVVNFSYICFSEIVYLVIENIREFYTEEKVFRVTGDSGKTVFRRVKNSDIFRADEKSVFDVSVTVEKSNPYSRALHNSLILELAGAGLLDPSNFAVNKFILDQLDFDGKDKLITDLENLYNEITQPKPAPVNDSGSGVSDPLVEIPGAEVPVGDEMVEIPAGDMSDPLIEIPVG